MGPVAVCLGIVAVTCGVLMYLYAAQVDALRNRLFYGKGGAPVTRRRELWPWLDPMSGPGFFRWNGVWAVIWGCMVIVCGLVAIAAA
jgi:hypothetical protein